MIQGKIKSNNSSNMWNYSWGGVFSFLKGNMSYSLIFYYIILKYNLGFHGGSDGKESACDVREAGSISRSGRPPWRKKSQPTPVFLPGEFHEEEPAGLQPVGLQRGKHNWATNTFTILTKLWNKLVRQNSHFQSN